MSVREQATIALPINPQPKDWAYIRLARPMAEAEWGYLLHLLEVMKPGLVEMPTGLPFNEDDAMGWVPPEETG